MKIPEIKQRLSLAMVLRYYGLKPDVKNRLHCPFHADKTPSMLVYYKTQTAYCFSGNCKTHGKSMDVIDFVMYKEGFDALSTSAAKHEALKKCKEILGYQTPGSKEGHPPGLSKSQFLGSMFQYFCNAVANSSPARMYLQQRGLDYKRLCGAATPVGYNGGQFHHGSRRDEQLIQHCLDYGLLLDLGLTSRTGNKAYGVFGKWCLCFALRGKEDEITGLYFRSTLDNKENLTHKKSIAASKKTGKHFYLKDRRGLYPGYPPKNTKKLILTESIIDGASLLQIESITRDYEILACYGTNGLTPEHTGAIKELKQLEEVIFFFDNDSAGRTAVAKYAGVLKTDYPELKLSSATPISKDINETLQGHKESIFIELLDKREELTSINSVQDIFSSNENSTEDKTTGSESLQIPEKEKTTVCDGSSLDFLKRKHLLENLNTLLGRCGIIGEEQSRMLLFLISISYVNKSPLHALVQGSSGSGKTHLISRIADMMPPQDVLRFTRITESSLYNWGEFDLYRKMIVIEDLDGLKEDALYALREFISNQVLRSSVTIKDKKGNNKSSHKIVQGQFSSLSATTKGETYEDNMSRSFLIAVDESAGQTKRIIDYQNQRIAGEIDPEEGQDTIRFIQSLVRHLKDHNVVNPYATKLQLPERVHKIRRLNEMYQAVIKQVTFLNQYSRKLTTNNQLITEIEDIEAATEILFESIVLKVDELDGSLRQFFEGVKKYLRQKEKKHTGDCDTQFTQREIRQTLGVSKAQCSRFINQLLELEYITSKFGGNLRKITYRVDYWDNHQKLRAEIKDFLLRQIDKLKYEGSHAPSKPKHKKISEPVGS